MTDAPEADQEAAVYVAFRDEGIRKFPFSWKVEEALSEDLSFFENSKDIIRTEIRSLTIGSAVNVPAVYATTGDDRIFRFALDGTPDYLVEQMTSLLRLSWNWTTPPLR